MLLKCSLRLILKLKNYSLIGCGFIKFDDIMTVYFILFLVWLHDILFGETSKAMPKGAENLDNVMLCDVISYINQIHSTDE